MARIAWLILFALLLAGCGQKGPLYMPEDSEAAKRYDPQDALPDSVQDSSSRGGSSQGSSSQNSSSQDSASEDSDSASQEED